MTTQTAARARTQRDTHATPSALRQTYSVVPLPNKLDALYDFVRSHRDCKAIIFLSSCAQVRFVHEIFCAMQPGVPLLAIHGKVKQRRRTLIYYDFCRRAAAVLLATTHRAGLPAPHAGLLTPATAFGDVLRERLQLQGIRFELLDGVPSMAPAAKL